MCPSGATSMSVDCCCQELILLKSQHAGLFKTDIIVISSKRDLFSPRDCCKISELPINNNHLLTEPD
jgi:hypothetical protein